MSLAGRLRRLAFPQPVGGVAFVRSHAVPSNRAASFLLIVRDPRDLRLRLSQFLAGSRPAEQTTTAGHCFPGWHSLGKVVVGLRGRRSSQLPGPAAVARFGTPRHSLELPCGSVSSVAEGAGLRGLAERLQ